MPSDEGQSNYQQMRRIVSNVEYKKNISKNSAETREKPDSIYLFEVR